MESWRRVEVRHRMFTGEDGTPITFLAGCDGLTKASHANVVLCKCMSHCFAERAIAYNVLSHQKVILQSDQEPTKPARTSQPKSCTKKDQLETVTPTEALSEQTNPSKDRSAQSRTTLSDRSVRRLVLTAQSWKWLVRHSAWTLTTFHVGNDGMTAHQRIRGKPLSQQIAAFGEQILFKPHKTAGPQQKLVVNWLDGCWLGFNTRTGERIVINNAAVQHSKAKQRRALES